MVPTGGNLPEDTFDCSICADLVLDPVTLPCCGQTFCRECLQCLLVTTAKNECTPRCPGCNERISFRLPASSRLVQRAIEAWTPDELRRRQQEALEAQAGCETAPDFVPGQEVAASQELRTGASIVAAFGSKGVVVSTQVRQGRITVKFDERVDGKESCLHVTPNQIMAQMPASAGTCVGQRVMASLDLIAGSTLLARFGAQGTVMGRSASASDRITVQFDAREDGSPRPVDVLPFEIQPFQALAGGFWPAEHVYSARDLSTESRLLVKAGTSGVIRSRYSDTRLSVKFATREDGSEALVNVFPKDLCRNGSVKVSGSGTSKAIWFGLLAGCALLLRRAPLVVSAASVVSRPNCVALFRRLHLL